MKKKVLIVNDSDHTREVLRNALQAAGHEVVVALTGREGVRTFHADRFDLLILDVNLPDTSGWNIFKTLTSINSSLPIVMTGQNDQRELAVFEGQTRLAELLDLPELLQTVARGRRHISSDEVPAATWTAPRCAPCFAGTVDMLCNP